MSKKITSRNLAKITRKPRARINETGFRNFFQSFGLFARKAVNINSKFATRKAGQMLSSKIKSSKASFLKSFKFGLNAEKIVMIFLWLKGYKILCWRYKNHCGEIDIIAKKRDFVVFVEVKARKNAAINREILMQSQIRRIKNSAEYFMSKNHKLSLCRRRFDFILVKNFFCIHHQKNFFTDF